MSSAAQAIAKAKTYSSYAVGRCDEFVAVVYGFGSSGYATAVKNWQGTPATLRHPGDWSAPAGSLMYWSGGSTGAGHVALSLGNGRIISTDATGPGVVGVIDARTPTDKWGHPYLGWTVPYFQGKEATSQLGGWSGATPVANNGTTGTQINSKSITSGFFSSIAPVFNYVMMSGVWFTTVGIGIAFILFGVFVFVKGNRG